MDKKALRSIPRPVADPSYFELVKDAKKAQWLVKVEMAGDVMQAIAWDVKELQKGKTGASLRLFFGDDDYITQDLKAEKAKWYKGKVFSVLHLYWWSSSPEKNIVFADDESRQLLEKRFPPKTRIYDGTKSLWAAIDDWQDTILEKKLKEKHYKQLAPVRAMMELVPDLPEGLEEWVHDQVMRTHRYLVYDGNSSVRMRAAFCTECGKQMVIDSKAVRLRMDEWGECPCCGSPVYMKTFKRWHANECGTKNAAVFQKLEDGQILARVFRCTYIFCKEGDNKVPASIRIRRSESIQELARVFMNGYSWQCFEYAEYKQSRRVCWCPDMGVTGTNNAVVWTKGLRELLADTPYRYSGLEAYQDHVPFGEIPLFGFLRAYEKVPDLERVVKAGLIRMADEVATSFYCYKDDVGKLRQLDKQQLQIMRRLDGGHSLLNLLQEIRHNRIKMTEAELEEYVDTFGTSTNLLYKLMDMHIRSHRFAKWALKQTGSRKPGITRMQKMRDLYHDWDDYIAWCRELGYDLNDEYVTMPPDFKKAHDRVMEELQKARDEQMRRELERIEAEIRETMSSIAQMDPVQLRSKKFMIVLPSSADDLKKEGSTLHHCVATYADRVAKGQTLILFIRQISEPDTPFYTMEWRDNRVIQCRGSHNKDMTPDVKTFVTAFEKRMQETVAAG